MEISLIKQFLDKDNKVKIWPTKHTMKKLVLEYLGTKFQYDIDYSEKEVNNILLLWHTFNDYPILRRGLIMQGILCRTNDGVKYWKNKDYIELNPLQN